MHGNHPELRRLIHDNLWVVISFAFAQPRIQKIMSARIKGSWPPLEKTVSEVAELRADRALIEMATQLRVLDDTHKIAEWQKNRPNPWPLGEVTQIGGKIEPLWFRDFTNKVLHAEKYEWNLSKEDDPRITIYPHDGLRWVSAEVNVVGMMMFVGEIAF